MLLPRQAPELIAVELLILEAVELLILEAVGLGPLRERAGQVLVGRRRGRGD